MKIEIELDNLTKEEQETVKRLAEKKKKAYWVPNVDERYWYLRDIGDVFITENNETGVDDFRISIGNCFKTEKQAREAFIRMQMQTKWKQLSLEAGEADNSWDGKHKHYYAYWDCRGKKLRYDYNDIWIQERIYFPSAESIYTAITELGEENVKRYILGVME